MDNKKKKNNNKKKKEREVKTGAIYASGYRRPMGRIEINPAFPSSLSFAVTTRERGPIVGNRLR